jgi:intracellular multiplication protein IcmO
MAQKKNRITKGVDFRNEVDPNKMYRDSRTIYEKFRDAMFAEGGLIVIMMITGLVIIETIMALLGKDTFGLTIWFILFLPLFRKRSDRIVVLPFKKPETSGELDVNQLHPVTNMPEPAKGISFYGNEMSTRDQIWFANDDVRTHCLIFGTTGAGKTETLLSICMNSLIHASGFIYVDGKGDNSLFLKVFSMVRRMGREDDLLLINYMTGTVDVTKKTFDKLSNTMNPFNSGSADALTELIVSLLPSGGGDGMWKGRAAIFMAALMRVLVALRDDRKIMLDVNTIRKYFSLEKLEELVDRDDVLKIHKEGLQDYVWNLPGYVKPDPAEPNKKIEQDFGVFEQHGFITMQYTEAFGLLSDTYGHIMKTQLAEVDFYDVVVNRRILVVLLPALEKSTQSLGNLGKIVVASVRSMMAQALGSKVEGSKKDVVDAKPTNSPSPYTTVFDEWGYYAVEGAAVMPAQARSLGFAMIFAGQDYQAFKKGSAEEAASIVANCAVKICMKLEDPTETLDIFTKAAGEASVNVSSGTQLDKNSTAGGYIDSGNANVTSKARIVGRDLKDQIAGESHILFGDTFVRAKMFYAAPEQVQEQRINKFLKVPMPEYAAIKRLTLGYNRINRSYNSFLSDESQERIKELSHYLKNNDTEDMSILEDAMTKTRSIKNIQQRAIFALYMHNKKQKLIDAKITDDKEAIDALHESKGTFTESKGNEIQSYDDNNDFDIEIGDFDSEPLFDIPKSAAREEVTSSVEEITSKRSLGKSESSVDKLREKTQKNYQELESRAANNKYSPYKIMGMDIKEVESSLRKIEKDLSKDFIDRGFVNSEEKGSKDYSEMATEKVISDISGTMKYASEVKLQKRDNNRKIVTNAIDDILIKEIE